MDVSDARRLKALEEEKARLKKLLAEQMLMLPPSASLFQKKYDSPYPCKVVSMVSAVLIPPVFARLLAGVTGEGELVDMDIQKDQN